MKKKRRPGDWASECRRAAEVAASEGWGGGGCGAQDRLACPPMSHGLRAKQRPRQDRTSRTKTLDLPAQSSWARLTRRKTLKSDSQG